MVLAEKRGGLYRLFSVRQEFPREWNAFFNQSANADQSLSLGLTKERFPFLFQATPIQISITEHLLGAHVDGSSENHPAGRVLSGLPAHDSRDPNYNLTIYDPMWAAIQDCDLPITFHVSTGRSSSVS